MMEMAAISGALVSLKTASEIAKNLIGLRDATLIDGQILELRRQLSEAVEACLTVKLAQSAHIDRIRELEARIVDLKTWDAQKDDYKLAQWKHGITAYVPKDCVEPRRELHALCATYYDRRKKSILQSVKNLVAWTVKCGSCKMEVTTTTLP